MLLSALPGGCAKRVLEHPRVAEVVTASAVLAEVQEYAAQLAVRKGLPLDIVLMAVATLPVTVVGHEIYAGSVPEARRRIGKRDPDDVELLALAIHTGFPLWSNDNDFADAGVDWVTTAALLSKLD